MRCGVGGPAPTTALHPGVQGPGPRRLIKGRCRTGWRPHPEDPEEVSLPCQPSQSSRGWAWDCRLGIASALLRPDPHPQEHEAEGSWAPSDSHLKTGLECLG